MSKKKEIAVIGIIILLFSSNIYMYYRFHILETNNNQEIEQLKDQIGDNSYNGWNSAKIVLPSKIVYCPGTNLDIFYDNVICGMRADLANACYVDQWEFTSMKKFARMDLDYNKWIDANMVVNVAEDKNLEKEFTLAMVEKNKTVKDGRKVLFIGDSITQDGRYVKEVYDLFKKDGTDIELLGTFGEENYRHEGRGGGAHIIIAMIRVTLIKIMHSMSKVLKRMSTLTLVHI